MGKFKQIDLMLDRETADAIKRVLFDNNYESLAHKPDHQTAWSVLDALVKRFYSTDENANPPGKP